MADLAIMASGSGSNFQAIAEWIRENSSHRISCMICDRKKAPVFSRAERLGIPSYYINYTGRTREEAEKEIDAVLRDKKTNMVALAGYMRLLTPWLIDRWTIINIHPALLPKYPGTHGIEESFNSKDTRLGITIHRVDYGMDTGPVIHQASFIRSGRESLEEIENRIHKLEHEHYPSVLNNLLNEADISTGEDK